MPSYNKNGRGLDPKRGRPRAQTPERTLRRRSRDHPPPKRRSLRLSTRGLHNERSRREDYVSDRVGSTSTSRQERIRRNSRGPKRKSSTIEPCDEEEEQPQRKRQHVETEGRSPPETGKSTKQGLKKKSTCAKDNKEAEEDSKSRKSEEKENESDEEKETGQEKTNEEDTKDENQKKDAGKKKDESDTEEDDKEKDKGGKEKKHEGKTSNDNDDDDDDTTAGAHGGGSASSEDASAKATKPENSRASSNSENTYKGRERERSSCMGCCDSREEGEWQYRHQLRIPPKDASEGMTMPSGMLVGMGITNWDVLMPLLPHEESDEWTTESLMELFANPGYVSPPMPPQVSSSGPLDLERLLDLYDIDMPQDYHTSINGNEDGV